MRSVPILPRDLPDVHVNFVVTVVVEEEVGVLKKNIIVQK